MSSIAIFWDYENCSPPSNSPGLGYDIVNNITRIARLFGSVTSFRAYLDISAQSPKSVALRSELQSSGVSIIDCPHNGKKDVVDKMILVDMLAFAVDHPTPATIFLITGDRDYAYAVSILKLRKYQIILVVPSPHTSPSLESQASLVIDWSTAVLRTRIDPPDFSQSVRQPYLDLDPTLVTKLSKELQDFDPGTTLHPYTTPLYGASRLRRVTARDLMDPSRHSKNTESFDSTRDVTHNPASPKKSTTSASDSAPGGLPIPKTPSRSRRGSVSAVSTRARSTTTASQSPPALEQRTTVKNPPPTNATQPSTSDLTDGASPKKHTLSVFTSLDPLELPLHDDCPPSSIIVHSPMPRICTPSSFKLNHLASPFVMTKALTGFQSVPDQHSDTRVQPISQTVAPIKSLAETVPAVGRTPQMTDIGVSMDMERVTSLRIKNEADLEPGARVVPDLIKSNCQPCIATHSSSSRNVALHLTDTPSSVDVFLPWVVDSVDSVSFTASSCASNARERSTLGTVSVSCPSTPSTTMESLEHDGSEQWSMFKPLIYLLLAARERGIIHPSRSTIAVDLVQSDKHVYKRAGVSKFKEYTALAEQAGIIELGGRQGDAWIALQPNWFGIGEIITNQRHSNSNRVSSPTLDPPKVGQNPFLTGPEMIERAAVAVFQTAGRSHSTGDTSPINRQRTATWRSIPAHFQPLIDTLVQIRAEGAHQPRRSLVGQTLNPHVYYQAGVSGFKEYIQKASEAQLIEFGGIGGHAWIRLHPELRF